jgi:hypothetical protein
LEQNDSAGQSRRLSSHSPHCVIQITDREAEGMTIFKISQNPCRNKVKVDPTLDQTAAFGLYMICKIR